MAGDPSNLLPFRWVPGQTGNPGGSSAKRRQARRLREALDTILGDETPGWLLDRLPPELAADCPDGVTFAELVALRLVWTASTATKPSEVLAAAQLIISAQAKPDALATREVVGTPKLDTTEERRRQVADQLGVNLEAPPKPAEAPDSVH